MYDTTRDVLDRLAAQAEAVCAAYLPAGRRQGRYWLVGDIDNSPGSSLFVGLSSGKWLDGKTGEHGDLLDIIRHRAACASFPAALDAARRFLDLPSAATATSCGVSRHSAARRLFALTRAIDGSLGIRYLRGRGITAHPGAAVRFHANCFVRPSAEDITRSFPAIVAAMTDDRGKLRAVHRIWLRRDGTGQAPFADPKRSMGDALGTAIRIGLPDDAMVAGEGIENVLTVRCLLPSLAGAAATSAAHLGALVIPPGLRRLYVAHDGDDAAAWAFERLSVTTRRIGVEAIALHSPLGDLNAGLCQLGPAALLSALSDQLARVDRHRVGVLRLPEKGRGVSEEALSGPAAAPCFESRATAF